VKKLHVKTYGCQMNVYDSIRMAELMAEEGYVETGDVDDADLVVLNTCNIREKAAEKLFSDLGRLGEIKALRASAGSPVVFAVAGCVAQAEGGEILRRAKDVEIVIGPQSYHRLPALVEGAMLGRRAVETDFPAESKFDHLPPRPATTRAASAYLSVQEGCDKFCSFCVVPYTRGSEYSRPVPDVLAEATRLVASGAREIVLLGQNVNAYHGASPDDGDWGLGNLIRAVAEIPGIARIRYMTSHPNDVDDELTAAHRDVEALMPFLHLPVQSGSDRVLADMNRRHTAADYRRTIDRLRAARPDLALSSDFIVGFPGESDADFTASLELARDIGFAQAFSFKYSARPGTPAATRADQVPEPVKTARLQELQALLAVQQQRFNAGFVGRTMPVLFDKPGRHPGQLGGRSPWLQAVHAEAPESLLGRIAEVAVAELRPNSLTGVLTTRGAA